MLNEICFLASFSNYSERPTRWLSNTVKHVRIVMMGKYSLTIRTVRTGREMVSRIVRTVRTVNGFTDRTNRTVRETDLRIVSRVSL